MRKTSEVAKDIPRFPHALLFIPENYPSDEAYLKAREEYFEVEAEAEARIARRGYPPKILTLKDVLEDKSWLPQSQEARGN